MLRSFVSQIWRRPTTPSVVCNNSPSFRWLSSSGTNGDSASGVAPEDMPYLHHKKRPRYRDYVKFKSPRKRASSLLSQLQQETVEKSKQAKPEVFGTKFAVGDAIECEIIEQGGVNSSDRRKVRGVVLGKYNKGMDTSVLIRDVLFGSAVERLLPLHSPTVKSLRLLEKNFIYKGRRKVKRAKLYFLRDRNDNGTSF